MKTRSARLKESVKQEPITPVLVIMTAVAFVLPFIIFRLFFLYQELGYLPPGPVISINGVHVHHWQIALLLIGIMLPIYAVLHYYEVGGKYLIYYIAVPLAFLVGTVVDGLIGY